MTLVNIVALAEYVTGPPETLTTARYQSPLVRATGVELVRTTIFWLAVPGLALI